MVIFKILDLILEINLKVEECTNDFFNKKFILIIKPTHFAIDKIKVSIIVLNNPLTNHNILTIINGLTKLKDTRIKIRLNVKNIHNKIINLLIIYF